MRWGMSMEAVDQTRCSTACGNSSIWLRQSRSSRRDIFVYSFGEHVVPNPAVDRVEHQKVDFPHAEDCRKLLRHFAVEPTRRSVFEVHQHVYVAPFRIKIAVNH